MQFTVTGSFNVTFFIIIFKCFIIIIIIIIKYYFILLNFFLWGWLMLVKLFLITIFNDHLPPSLWPLKIKWAFFFFAAVPF